MQYPTYISRLVKYRTCKSLFFPDGNWHYITTHW